MERLKMLLKNTFEGVHLVAKLTATSLQLVNLLKMNFFTHWKGTSHFNGGPSFFSVCVCVCGRGGERGGGRQVGQAMGDINFDGDVFNAYKKHIYIISLITTFSFCW